ncbi:MAG: peptidylprolyl isomerase [Oscillospiraceae bacterium]|nr:peptidylprolyl isomerase [Oscillospiraceae bacterium]
MKKSIKVIGVLTLMIFMLVALTGCLNNEDEDRDENRNERGETENGASGDYPNPVVTIEIEEFGTVKIELYPETAPETVKNFISLINQGYYDGLTFHRIERGAFALIQGGDWEGTGAGRNDYSVVGEFTDNNFRRSSRDTLSFERGVVGLARLDFFEIAMLLEDPTFIEKGHNSGFAQFFIMATDAPDLDGRFAAFGRVIEGMDVVDEIIASNPADSPVMRRVTVDTFGREFREPELLESFDINAWIEEMLES